jgi:indole-3-glycerol phosphate synthase
MILDDIVQVKKLELRKAKEIRKFAELKAKARNAAPLQPFELRKRGEVSIIAEVKRASPVKGVLKADLDPAEQALKYREGGASAISVLTDEQFFKGSVADLRAARNAAGLPILRKDFIIDEYSSGRRASCWPTRPSSSSASSTGLSCATTSRSPGRS